MTPKPCFAQKHEWPAILEGLLLQLLTSWCPSGMTCTAVASKVHLHRFPGVAGRVSGLSKTGAQSLIMNVCRVQDLANKDSMLHHIDCGSSYINSTNIIKSVMPDGLHPNHVGMEMLAQVRHHTALMCSTPSHPDMHPPSLCLLHWTQGKL